MALKSTERRIDELELEIASLPILTDGDKGDITVSSSGTVWTVDTSSTRRFVTDAEKSTWNGKQDALVSGTNIKTINSISLLGGGDIAISTGITIGTTAITSGTANRILFQNGSGVVSQSANLTFDAASGFLQGGVRIIAGTNGMTNTGGALFVYAGNSNDFVQRIINTSGTAIIDFRTTGNGSMMEFKNSAGAVGLTIKGGTTDALVFGDLRDIGFGTGTGTKIGYATNQKFAFWNKTPIVQPTTAIASATFNAVSHGTNIDTNDTFDGYTVGQVVQALRNIGILA